MLIKPLDQLVHLVKVQSCIGKGEVTPKRNQHMVSKIVPSHFIDVFLQLPCFLIGIESVQLFVRHKWIIIAEALIIGETRRPAIMISHHTCEDLLLVSKMLGKWSP